MKNNGFGKRNKKISFGTRMRFLLLGKRPLERKFLPKIIEYLFIIFANFMMFLTLIILLNSLRKYNFDLYNKEHLKEFIDQIKTFEARLLLIVAVFSWIVTILMSIHLGYIYSKTEKAKWVNICCIISNLLCLLPLSLIFAIWGYIKNEIVFE